MLDRSEWRSCRVWSNRCRRLADRRACPLPASSPGTPRNSLSRYRPLQSSVCVCRPKASGAVRAGRGAYPHSATANRQDLRRRSRCSLRAGFRPRRTMVGSRMPSWNPVASRTALARGSLRNPALIGTNPSNTMLIAGMTTASDTRTTFFVIRFISRAAIPPVLHYRHHRYISSSTYGSETVPLSRFVRERGLWDSP